MTEEGHTNQAIHIKVQAQDARCPQVKSPKSPTILKMRLGVAGTDEELFKASYELIPTRRCLVRVADSYVSQEYGANMDADIRNEFIRNEDLKDYEDYISRLPQ